MLKATITLLTLLPLAPLAAQETLQLPAGDRPLAVRYEPLFSIGAADGQDWEILSGVTRLGFDDRGSLYVLDSGNLRVLVFGPDGRFVRQIGRPGGGPGEFQLAAGLAVFGDGSLAVGTAFRALSVFDSAGTYVRNVGLGEIRALYPSLQPDGRGGVVLHETSTSQETPNATEFFGHSLRAGEGPVIRHSVARADTMAGRMESTPTGFRRVLPPVFAPQIRYTVWGPDRLAVAAGVDYALEIAGGTGPRRIERAIRARAVSERDKEAVREARRARATRPSPAAAVGGFTIRQPTGEELEAELRALRFAETLPVITGVASDRAGRLWVARTGPVALGPGPIDILSPDGRYLGTLPATNLPAAFGPDGRIARTLVDPAGFERVVVERVVGLDR